MVRRASTGELDSILPTSFQGVKGSKVRSKRNSGELDDALGQGPDASYQKFVADRQKEEEKKKKQSTPQEKSNQSKNNNELIDFASRVGEGIGEAFTTATANTIGGAGGLVGGLVDKARGKKVDLGESIDQGVKDVEKSLGRKDGVNAVNRLGVKDTKKYAEERNKDTRFKAGQIVGGGLALAAEANPITKVSNLTGKAIEASSLFNKLRRTGGIVSKLTTGAKYGAEAVAGSATGAALDVKNYKDNLATNAAIDAATAVAPPLIGKFAKKLAQTGTGKKIINSARDSAVGRAITRLPAKKSESITSIDEAATRAADARTPKKIEVGGPALGEEKVGVKTPVRPGIRQESTTYKVQPRTPQKISNETYTKKFNKISKEYDKEVKQLEKKPALTQEAGMQQVDDKFRAKLDQLDKEHEKGTLPQKTIVTKVDKNVSKAEPTTGGAPTEGVNVRSSLYKPDSKKLRVSGEEATQKLAKAGYTTDESKAILSDALSNRGLSMPGSPKKVGYDEQSIAEAARNYDGEAATLPEVKPLKNADSEKGTSRLGQSVLSEAQKSKLITKAEAESANLPQYTKANMKDQATYANELIKSAPDDAIEIAMGRKAPPEHILPQIVFNVVEAHAKTIGGEEGAQLLRDLARSKQVTNLSTMAQNVRAAAERDPHSPVTLMNDVKLSRMEKLKRNGKSLAKEQKADAKAIKSETPKVKKEDWDSFIEGIKC